MIKVDKILSADRPVYWLVIIAIALRSMIAPGYMLSVNGEGPTGIGITLCEGLNGSIKSAITDNPHSDHSGSPADNHDAGHEPSLTSCGLWSTSSLYDQAISLIQGNLREAGPDQYQHDYYKAVDSQTTHPAQQPRAPPALLFV